MLLLTANPQLKGGHRTSTILLSAALTANSSAHVFWPLPGTAKTHIYTLSPPPPLRRRDSFVTKMNLSSALQPKQVIWLPQPQIKLVWFNFRFGLLLQPYIKGDVFHYTAKPQASRRWRPAPSIGRHHGSIMAVARYCCRSSKDSGGAGAIGGLVIHKATQPRSVQPTYWACSDSCRPSRDNVLAVEKKNHMRLLQASRFSFQLRLSVFEMFLLLVQHVWQVEQRGWMKISRLLIFSLDKITPSPSFRPPLPVLPLLLRILSPWILAY